MNSSAPAKGRGYPDRRIGSSPDRVGSRRQAIGFTNRPRLLLLDKPMAGLGPEESQRMLTILRELKGMITILLVEHDMEGVFALADRITVLVEGRAIASGSPETIRAHAEVRRAYLGG